MDTPLAKLSYIASVVLAILTLPSLVRIAKSPWRAKSTNGGLYEDKDGKATEESVAGYSTKRSFTVVFVAVATGLATSFALAVFATVRRDHSYSKLSLVNIWVLFAAWIAILLQIIHTSREEEPVKKFNYGILNAASCFLAVVLAWTVILGQEPQYPDDIVLVALTVGQILIACAIIFTLFSIQRRPDVFRPDGRIVERESTRSILSWITFSWSSDLLDMAGTKVIEVTDLPSLPASVRSEDRIATFRGGSLKPTVALWKLILWSFRGEFVMQWFLVILSSLLDAAPQYTILRLLQYLEARQGFAKIDPQAWLWVGTLLVSTVSSTLVNNRITWRMYSHLAIPIRSILTTLIFEKMMKIKDCKDPPKTEEKENTKASKADDPPKENGAHSKPNPKSETSKDSLPQTQHDITNMFTVDANLVGFFGANSQFYIHFTAKIIVSITFLWLLVGWQSLFAGLAALVLMIPVNSFLARRYRLNQKALMKARDAKTKVITEALNGIRQIKFSATESQWADKIYGVRENELGKLWNTQKNNTIMILGNSIAPVLLVALALSTYAYIHGELLPSVAFTALGVFMQLEGVLGMTPFLLVMGLNAKVSSDRIDSFLQSDERPKTTYPGDSIVFDNASVSFPSDSKESKDDRFVLRSLTLNFPDNSLSVISGPTGSGKSLLLAAILGEVELLSGSIRVPRPPPLNQRYDSKATSDNWILPTASAFVSQTPWIENATIKDNIRFGLPLNEERYNKVLEACALTKDLEMFEDGDSTEVGAQGISLSGGQKWRLTLARALYSRAGILILDDVFSAIDAHVGKEIYENALMGELAEGRTRILVTHHVSLCLPRAKYAVSLSAQGTVEHAGLVDELRTSGNLEEILKTDQDTREDEEEGSSEATLENQANGSNSKSAANSDPEHKPKKLIEDEKRETGNVKSSVYLSYLKATGGFPFWTVVLLFYFVAQGLTLSRSWWIKIWTSSYEQSEGVRTQIAHVFSVQAQLITPPRNSTVFLTQASEYSIGYYLAIYVGISAVSVLVATARFLLVFRGSLRASRRVFKTMTNRVLRTPLRWLDTEPTGRILNRFTADFQSMDSQLASELAQTGASVVQILGIMAAAFFVSPYMIILAFLLFGACGQIARRYLRGARGFKRLESIQKSPMISHFSTSLQGLSTIRAFANSEVFISRMHDLIDSFALTTWHNSLFSNWVGFRMAMVGSLFSSVVAAFIVSTPGVSSGLAGFALAFSLEYKGAIIQAIRQIANVELNMNAAERIFEYTQLNTEDENGAQDLRASWPEEGKLVVKELEVGYAEGLPSILKGLSFTAEKNERIGVVGRTGAGKSTLSLALFRFLQARKGSIVIDGVDISTIKLNDLRTRLAIIPQDPVLFSGTIRSNLDPFDQFSDFQLKEALKRAHLIPSADNTPVPELETAAGASTTVASSITGVPTSESSAKENTNIFLSLASPISQAGSNLSQGQRQLLCLARAMLSRPKVLLLDEATSAVDMATDLLIQRSIREEFANTTLLVIAHRLSTVADFDKILVMRDGVAAEFGTPKGLLEMEEGIFKEMVAQSGEKESLEKTILGY